MQNREKLCYFEDDVEEEPDYLLNILQDPLLDTDLIDPDAIKKEIEDEEEYEEEKNDIRPKRSSKVKKKKKKRKTKIIEEEDVKVKKMSKRKEVELEIAKSEGKLSETGDYVCSRCPLVFVKPCKLVDHVRTEHNVKLSIYKHTCDFCDLDFKSMATLKRHIKDTHNDKSEELDSRSSTMKLVTKTEYKFLKEHGTKNKKGVWSCNRCDSVSANKKVFYEHLRSCHKIVNRVTQRCPLCEKTFKTSTSLKYHIKRMHKTSVTPDEYPIDGDLIKENGRMDQDGAWWCSKCGLRYLKENLFAIHLKKSHKIGPPIVMHKCQYCNYDFTQPGVLKRHIRNSHPEKLAESSEESSSSTQTLLNELSELNKYGKKNEHGTWLCGQCSAMYGRKSAFIKHLTSSHEVQLGNARYDCESCEEYFLTRRALNDHISSKHKNKKPVDDKEVKEDTAKLMEYGHIEENGGWKCNACPSVFVKNYRFIYHLKRAHDVTIKTFMFACVQCNLSFLSIKALRAHNNSAHPDSEQLPDELVKEHENLNRMIEKEGKKCGKGWQCNRCGAKYTRDTVFMYHLKRYHNVDLGDFQHKCEYCHLDFMVASGLRYHVLKKHPEKSSAFLKSVPPDEADEGGRKSSEDEEEGNSSEEESLMTIKKRKKGKDNRQGAKEQEIMKKEGKKDSEGSWWCGRCGSRCSKDAAFLYHLKRTHELDIGSFVHRCEHCSVEFISKPALRRHVNRVHPEVNHLRNASDLLQASILENHTKCIEDNFFKDSDNHWVCKICGSKFVRDTSCLYHLKRDHSMHIEGFDYRCNLCELDYRDPHSLKIHVKRCHTVNKEKLHGKYLLKDNKYICIECKKTFLKLAGFMYHYARIHEVNDNIFKYQCKICNSKFISPKGVRLHLVTIHSKHTDTSDYIEILKTVVQKQKYEGEKLNISINKKINDMALCEESPKKVIADDIVSSNQDVVHQCRACGYLLSSRKNFMDHLETIHTLEYEALTLVTSAAELEDQLLCVICNVVLMSSEEFERHVKCEHSAQELCDILLECKHCSYFTMSSFCFKMHLKTVHSIPSDENYSQWPCMKCNLDNFCKDDFVSHVLKSDCYLPVEDDCYKCTECFLVFKDKSLASFHFEECHLGLIINSSDIVLSNRLDNSGIRNVISETKVVQCPYCASTVKQLELKTHLLQNHSMNEDGLLELKYNCSFCMKVYPKYSLLTSHIEEEHKNSNENQDFIETDGEIKCKICNLKFMDKVAVLAHISEHNIKKQKNNPVCSLCSQQFTNNSSLRRHIQVIHITKNTTTNKIKRPAVCDVCSQTFMSYLALLKHFRQNHIDDTVISGNTCFEIVKRDKTESKQNLSSFKCKLCTFIVKTRERIEIHLINKHWTGKKPLNCQHCDYNTASQLELESHTYTLHPDIKEVKDSVCLCDECGKSFHNKMTFYLHKGSHKSPKYNCKFCDYTSHLKTSMITHERTHTKEKPFKCDVEGCDFSSSTAVTLKYHKFSHDPEKYMQTCEICNYKTVNKYVMRSHMKEHNNQKIINESVKSSSGNVSKCNLCDFVTKYKQTMKKHLNKRHGITVSKDDNVKWF